MATSGSNKPYSMIGTVDPRFGTRELSVKEVARLVADNPELQDAIERINNFEGCARMTQKIIHEDYGKNIVHIKNEKHRLDKQFRKSKGMAL